MYIIVLILTTLQDSKVLEVICECLSNIVERYKSDVETLKKIGEYKLLQKYQVNGCCDLNNNSLRIKKDIILSFPSIQKT